MASRMTEDELTAARRSRAARIAVDTSWARTPNRSERTAPARRNSPTTYDYWLAKISADPAIRPKDRAKAAASAHRAYMTQLSAKAAEARRKRAAAS